MRRPPFAAATIAACLSLSCGFGGDTLEVTWDKPAPGRFKAPMQAVWCEADRRLELMAASGDSGVGLVLYPAGELKADLYPLFVPSADTVPRPGAAVAIRWYSESMVRGLQADSGDIELARAHPPLSGSFTVRLHSTEGVDTFRVSGKFSGLKLQPCPQPPAPPPARPSAPSPAPR